MILITGSSGFIGTNVTRYFIQKGEDVVGVDVSEPQISFEREQFTLHRCDLTDRTSVSKAFKKFKPEKVVHLAFVTRPKEPYREFLDDARITLNMLQSALEHDVQRFVLMSSSTVYGLHKEDRFVEEEEILDPRGVYGKAKLTAEMMAKEYLKSQNLPVVILRGFEIYGPYLTPPTIVKILLQRAFKGEKVRLYCYGKQKTDFTYVEDVCQGMEVVLKDQRTIGKTYNVAFGEPHTYEELGKMIKKFVPCEIELLPARNNEKPFFLYATAAKLKSLGYHPKYDLEEGIKRTVEWMSVKHG